jgi:GntR family carbon starvation induced transcriptional regulator
MPSLIDIFFQINILSTKWKMLAVTDRLDARNLRTGEASGKTLATHAVSALRQWILDGALAPGSRLRIEELRARFGMGASPLREALSQLAAEGLVQRLDQRGFRVATADASELNDLIETRCLIEGAALRASIEAGDDGWEECIIIAHRRLSRVPRSLDAETFIPNPEWDKLHLAFHKALIGACRATTVLEICETLHHRATRFRNLSNAVAWRRREVGHEHDALVAAVLERRANEAVDLLLNHYRKTGALVGDALSS